jgi:hypothetical protein
MLVLDVIRSSTSIDTVPEVRRLLQRGRYWDEFDPDFFQEDPYRRLIWRSFAAVTTVAVGLIAWGLYSLIANGDKIGLMWTLAGSLFLGGARVMFLQLWRSRNLPRRSPPE